MAVPLPRNQYEKKVAPPKLFVQCCGQIAGFKAIIILGNPFNYFKHGFRSSRDFAISDLEGKFPFRLLALELEKGFLSNAAGKFYYSAVYDSIDKNAVEKFDAQFDYKKKEHCYTQDLFTLAFRTYVG